MKGTARIREFFKREILLVPLVSKMKAYLPCVLKVRGLLSL